jgi:murein DD-endopeptidase MepM/ murein hydrolase activator NlpD
MRGFAKFLLFLVVLGVIVGGAAWWWAGRQPAPSVEFRQPEKFVGQNTALEMMVQTPQGQLSRLDVTLEQNGKSFPIFTLNQPTQATTRQEAADRLFVSRPIGKRAIPELQPGPARIVVHAARPVMRGLRQLAVETTRDVQVRLEPPQASVLSMFHYVNLGGAEFIVYRATPADVESGVRVGDRIYPGFPGSAVGITSDPAIHVAFFALAYDQDVNTPITVFAHDPAGNIAAAVVDHMAFSKAFSKSTIPIDSWVARVVPPIVANTPSMQGESTAPADLPQTFVKINSDLRRQNAQTIADLAKKTAPQMMWKTSFEPLTNAAIEAKFADFRTYTYMGKEIDRQVHLGFDLAVTQQVPIKAAQTGVVVHAAYLGIYGNCVIIDHGLGVQTLYGHLSSIGVKVGDKIEKGQVVGRSGMTGLAAGDHLHFTVLVNGTAVNPVEWWDPKWMQDRVFRKVMEAGGSVS